MSHVGVNVYCWGRDAQRRFLLEQAVPLARRLLDERAIEAFWFTAFDARGPHLTLLFTPGEASRAALRDRLEGAIREGLAAVPSDETLDPPALAERHRQCRGKELCAADALPGIAGNNTFVLFDHPDDGYPYSFGVGLPRARELWRRVGEVVLWTADRLAAGDAGTAAIRWLAAVDAAIGRCGLPAEACWRYHATTLVPPLAARLAADEEAVLASLPGVVGERNRESFSRHWPSPDAIRGPGPDVDSLVGLASAPPPAGSRWSLLREINHTTLGQLGLPVRLHLPLVFYAWQRHSPSPA